MTRIPVALLAMMFAAASIAMPSHTPRPGGVAVFAIDSEDRPRVFLEDRQALVIRTEGEWTAIVGIPLNHEPGTPLRVSVKRSGLADEKKTIDLESANYRVQRLDVDRKYVDPGQKALERIFRERDVIDAALTNWRDQELTDVALSVPVPGSRSSSFGSRRIFNDQPRSPHKGMDIAAITGTPITSPMSGIVTATGDFYFNGNTIIVDHGQGLITLFCHLSEIDVIDGRSVDASDLLGKVGATGRVTGSHLHFATYLNGTAVDPVILLKTP